MLPHAKVRFATRRHFQSTLILAARRSPQQSTFSMVTDTILRELTVFQWNNWVYLNIANLRPCASNNHMVTTSWDEMWYRYTILTQDPSISQRMICKHAKNLGCCHDSAYAYVDDVLALREYGDNLGNREMRGILNTLRPRHTLRDRNEEAERERISRYEASSRRPNHLRNWVPRW